MLDNRVKISGLKSKRTRANRVQMCAMEIEEYLQHANQEKKILDYSHLALSSEKQSLLQFHEKVQELKMKYSVLLEIS